MFLLLSKFINKKRVSSKRQESSKQKFKKLFGTKAATQKEKNKNSPHSSSKMKQTHKNEENFH